MDFAIALIFAVILFISTSIYSSPGINTISPALSPFMVFRPESVTQTHQTEHIIISTSKTAQGTTILVEDDGPGFTDDDFADTNNEAHIGINNVTLRLQIMCGGTLNITPRPEGGTIVTILIP